MAKHVAHHTLTLDAQLGALRLAVELKLYAQWTMLFGPSGSGKTTILRAACGLLPGTHATFLRNHDPQGDGACEDLTRFPPHLRRLSLAPQHSALFPHLTVLQNLRFSTDATHTTGESLIDEALALFRLDALALRYPRDLSGGERRLVSLARAFARPDSQLLLLDEPFAGVDPTLRDAILPELRASLRDRGLPVLSISHDVTEAYLLQCEVVTLRNGRIEDQGYVSKVLDSERQRVLTHLHR